MKNAWRCVFPAVCLVGALFASHSAYGLHPLPFLLSALPLVPQGPPASGIAPSAQSDGNSQADPLAEARALLGSGKMGEAEHSVRTYLINNVNSADAHFLLGYILSKEVKAKESLAEYTEGAKYRVPGHFELKIVGIDYVLLGDYVDADKWLTRSLQDAPNDTEGWYYLGRIKYNENRLEDAVGAFQRCLLYDAKNVKAGDNMGLALQGLSRNDQAMQAYQTAISWQAEMPVKNPDPFINLGALLLELNRPQEAIVYLTQGLAIPSELYRSQGVGELLPRVHELLGKTYLQLNQLTQAQTELESAVALAPQSVRSHFLLGQVYRKEGLTAKAKAEFDRCAALAGTTDSQRDKTP
jgi:tetratricopeptide (TPR) repeat protein